jgi:predicted DNA-binding antitoxin AbrB/MazE fold protein
MGTVITAVYEKGVLRPLTPLTLIDQQTVRLQILANAKVEQIIPALISAGILTPPPGTTKKPPPSLLERRALADRLAAATQEPVSQLILAERDAR